MDTWDGCVWNTQCKKLLGFLRWRSVHTYLCTPWARKCVFGYLGWGCLNGQCQKRVFGFWGGTPNTHTFLPFWPIMKSNRQYGKKACPTQPPPGHFWADIVGVAYVCVGFSGVPMGGSLKCGLGWEIGSGRGEENKVWIEGRGLRRSTSTESTIVSNTPRT